MVLERRDSAGGAVDTTLSAGISAVDTSCTLVSVTGWPSGGANGPFWFFIDYDVAGIEKCTATSRTGNTLNGLVRGLDGTSATTHVSGATVRHGHVRNDTDEANYTMAQTVGKVTTKGDLIIASAANTFARLAVGSNNTVLVADSAQPSGTKWATLASTSLATDSVGSAQIAADSVGASEIAPLAVTAAEIANATITDGKMVADTLTAASIAANAIGSSELADNAVDTNAIANLAITAGKIANDTITATQLAADAVGSSELANNAVDTAAIANAAVTLAKFASEAGTTWGGAGAGAVGPLNNLTLGSGGSTYAVHMKFGRLVVMFFGFQLGSGGDLAGGALGLDLPFDCASITGFSGSDAAVGGFVACRAFNNATSERVSGTGVMATTEALNFCAAFTSSVWNFANPFDWSDAGSGSKLQGLGVYLATS